jgi:serine/threonine protein kinase
MWSIGTIATALLTGDAIFTDRTDPRYEDHPELVIFGNANNCDLDVLDQSNLWKDIGRRPKDLIRKLLVLDEAHRMTASQALKHEWFTHKRYANELEEVYQMSIADWKPRRRVFRLIEALDLDRLSASERRVVEGQSSSHSHYFPPPSKGFPAKLERQTALPDSQFEVDVDMTPPPADRAPRQRRQSFLGVKRHKQSSLPLAPIEEETPSELGDEEMGTIDPTNLLLTNTQRVQNSLEKLTLIPGPLETVIDVEMTQDTEAQTYIESDIQIDTQMLLGPNMDLDETQDWHGLPASGSGEDNLVMESHMQLQKRNLAGLDDFIDLTDQASASEPGSCPTKAQFAQQSYKRMRFS